ncbi:hypothetical protein NX059_012287 [Plenodomus lindquistii]|nr:hypothetical protein NX059_012287 [Plenodomus lindquistii]
MLFLLYAGLPTEQQTFAFQKAPPDTRKVILSTNIAEASVTIDGVVYVVDIGYVKLRNYDAKLGIENPNVVRVSEASATQPASRAGRMRPGNLAPIILQLLNLGITNITRFDYLSAPPSTLITRALDLLYSLGALDANARLTKPLGARMAELSPEPMLSKALLQATNSDFNCVSEMLTIAAMMTLQGNAFGSHDGNKKQLDNARRRFAVAEGDHITLYDDYEAFFKAGIQNVQWYTMRRCCEWR